MRRSRRSLLLGHRIIASVVIGLGLVLLLASAVAAWTLQGTADATYRDRVTLAQGVAQRVDDVLAEKRSAIERAGTDFTIQPGHPLTSDQRQRLTELQALVGGFAVISVTDVDGRTLWLDPPTAGAMIEAPLSHPGAYLALRTAQPQVAEFAPSGAPQQTFTCLVMPLRDPQGRMAGVLMGEFDVVHLAPTLLLSNPAREAIHIELIDAAGRELAGTTEYYPGAASEHGQLLAPLITSHTSGYRIHTPPSHSGMRSHIVAYVPVPLLPSWGIVLEEPQDAVLALQNQLAQRLGMVAFGTLVLGTLVAWVDVRRVVRPLRQLTAAAERFAAGMLDEPIRLDRGDEIGILAGAFETMRARLHASRAEVEAWNQELEGRVAARTAEVEARNRELAHLNALAETVSSSLDVGAMLDRALDRILEITGAENGCLLVPGDHDARLTLVAARPAAIGPHVGRSCAEDCLCGRAFHANQPMAADADANGMGAAVCPLLHPRSCLAMPLPAGERVQGTLFLGSSYPDYFEKQDLATLSAIGRQVGMALVNARLYQDLQARERERAMLLQQVMNAQEEERQRLAQELHDETSQALASLQLGLERLGDELSAPPLVRQRAAQLQDIAVQALASVHRLAVELRPSVLDDLGLVAAIERYLYDCAQRSAISADFAAIDADRLSLLPAAETALYRIVQGALTNVVQHAEAQHVNVLLKRRGQQLVVIVEDDGRGFELAEVRVGPLDARLGLAGMEERAALLGGTLTIETAPGAGTAIFIEVPLDLNSATEAVDGEAADRAGG